MCDDDDAGGYTIGRSGCRQGNCSTGQDLEYAFADLLNIRFAFAQIGIFDFIELGRELVDLGDQRPLGIVVTMPDDVIRFASRPSS